MILVVTGAAGPEGFEAASLFAGQLAQRGHPVMLDEEGIAGPLSRSRKYDVARFLGDPAETPPTRVIVIGAEHLTDTVLMRLRALALGGDVALSALGHFPDRQALIGARSRIAFACGREPAVFDLAGRFGAPLLADTPLPQTALVCDDATLPQSPARLWVLVPDGALAGHGAALDGLAHARGLRLTIVRIGGDGGPARRVAPVIAADELLPEALARRADLVALAGDAPPDARSVATLMAALGAGRPVIDCTAEALLCASGAPVLRGPASLDALGAYLDGTVLPNLAGIGRFVRQSPWLDAMSLGRVERAIGLAAPAIAPAAGKPATASILFMPTNGVGLGHAQRLGQIASAMAAPERCRFAAFPSCVGLIADRGFVCAPLVQKSPDHPEPYANDLVNYRRLDRLLPPGGRFVFDGGYIFDSIYRLILEKDLRALWVRRGLWRADPANEATLERGRIFDHVLVPDEAFAELNAPARWDPDLSHVGPVVQRSDPVTGLRDRLAERFGHPFRTLVVSLLGGGVAADRSAQLSTLCGHLERRADILHLIVTWPGARIEPGAYRWTNSRVVQTRRALALAQAADLAVSAAGYNSFHELIYHGVPTIFMPQTAPFMDDQERRARAASDRGLAETVGATELVRMEREIAAFLDEGKAAEIRAALADAALPAPGTADAAAIIDRVLAP